MKHLLSLLFICLVASTTAKAQLRIGATPWDVTYAMKDGEKRTVKCEKGKIMVISLYKYRVTKGGVSAHTCEATLKKADSDTKTPLEIAFTQCSDCNYLIKENDELLLEANLDLVVYISGYVYDIHP